MSQELPYNQIIENPDFQKACDEYRTLYVLMNDVYDDIGWTLGKDATEGRRIEESYYWIFETDQQGNTPGFWVLYKYLPQKHHIYLLSIKAAHVSYDE